MFCARCGQQIPDASEVCPLCGRETTVQLQPPSSTGQTSVTAASTVAPAIAPEQSQPKQERPINTKLKGIGGWLLFFCIYITILGPLAVLYVLLVTQAAATQFDPVNLGIVAIPIFGLVTGLTVWMESPRAIPMLRVYFIVLSGFAVSNVSLMLSAGLEEVDAWSVVAHVRTLVFVVLWVWYFIKSERVRATFGKNLL